MSFKITIQPSGHVFTANEKESVLDAAIRQGITFPYGCRGGSCGGCRGKVLEGEFRYFFGQPAGLSQIDIDHKFALFCQAEARSDLVIEVQEITSAQEIRVKNLPCRVEKMEKLAHDVMRLYLKLPSAERMQFFSGQYIEVLMKDGRRRAFSIANAPHEDNFIELHVRYVAGGDFTEHVFGGMQEKELLRIEGPLGTFYLREDSDKPIILMAGGTGFAPVKAILEHAFAEGITRPIHLYWGARAKRDLYLEALPRQWAQAHGNFTYTPVLSEPMAEDHWQGRTGFVHEAVLTDYATLLGYEVYACGPPMMVKTGFDLFTSQRGLAAEDYLSDAFEFAKDSKKK